MRAVEKADNYIIRFLYKKQIKADVIYALFLIFTTITSFATQNSIWLSLVCVLATSIVIGWTIRDLLSRREINAHNRAKVRLFYVVSLMLYLFMPSEMFMASIIFIIPFTIFFVDLVETYCGHDSLHWPYIFHFAYGSIIFLIVSMIKPFIPIEKFYVTDWFKVIYNPIAFTMIIDNIAGELVDLRTVFKAKAFRDEIIACYDELTEVHNRHGIVQLCDLSRATAIAMIDLDHFKLVNDTYDHNTGDFVLKEFANRLSTYGDNDNFICRWGGEEFIIISNSIGDLKDICVKLLIQMRSEPIYFTFKDQNIAHTQTFSCGITEMDPTKELDEMVKLADIQAYLSKENGRDHVYINNEALL